MPDHLATCSCGQLSVRTRGEPIRVSICHCLVCQKRTGSVFGTQARFRVEAVTIEGASTEYRRVGEEGGTTRFHFCPACGSTVFYVEDGEPGMVAIPVGAFADPGFPPPGMSGHEERRHAWVGLPARLDAAKRGSINHIDLTVSDLAASSKFYDRLLGLLGYVRSTQYEGGVPCWELSTAGSTLSIGLHAATLNRAHDQGAVGLHHLAFHLPCRADVDRLHDVLREGGVQVLDAPAEYGYTPGYYAVFFADPDGIKLELVHEPRFDRRPP